MMQAMQLAAPKPVEDNPLAEVELPVPQPGAGQIRIKVRACGICHTDLHTVEGEIDLPRLPLVPGHQIVGVVDKLGDGVNRFSLGDRVGVPWLYHTDGTCRYCASGRENLCVNAQFTGRDVDGGYAEYMVAPADFAYPLPAGFDDVQAAPLLCAGVIGYRALRLSEVKPGGKLALYGFGASAHITIQVARHMGCDVYVFTRGEEHRRLALQLGAAWAGDASEQPAPLDAAIIFAPAGGLVPQALAALDRGGTLALAGIYMTTIPQFDYALIYGERTVRSVANATRRDAEELLTLAAKIPIRTEVQTFALADANKALQMLKAGRIDGAAALKIGD